MYIVSTMDIPVPPKKVFYWGDSSQICINFSFVTSIKSSKSSTNITQWETGLSFMLAQFAWDIRQFGPLRHVGILVKWPAVACSSLLCKGGAGTNQQYHTDH